MSEASERHSQQRVRDPPLFSLREGGRQGVREREEEREGEREGWREEGEE